VWKICMVDRKISMVDRVWWICVVDRWIRVEDMCGG